ncbi:hypothetical protein ACGFWD_45115 [Streptomyces sp. NPDC048448]|uniref:hypothetical protein n=1 Tax=Streptomyces sp. NPDC048448 TaxID=3365554 RepID=UPI0037241DD3
MEAVAFVVEHRLETVAVLLEFAARCQQGPEQSRRVQQVLDELKESVGAFGYQSEMGGVPAHPYVEVGLDLPAVLVVVLACAAGQEEGFDEAGCR